MYTVETPSLAPFPVAAHRQHLVEPRQHRRKSLQVVSHQGQSGHRREVVLQLGNTQSAHADIVSTLCAINYIFSPSR